MRTNGMHLHRLSHTVAGTTRTLTPLLGGLVPQGLSRDGGTVLAAFGCGHNPGSTGALETIPFAGGPPTVIARRVCGGDWNA
jgi:hypothetical protein